MLNWIIILLLLVVGTFFLKFEHHGKKIILAIFIVAGLLLYLSVMAIFDSEEGDLSSPKGVIKTFYVWAGWFGNTISGIIDIGQDTVAGIGNVIKGNRTSEKAYDGRS